MKKIFHGPAGAQVFEGSMLRRDGLVSLIERAVPVGTRRRTAVDSMVRLVRGKMASYGKSGREFDVSLVKEFSPLSFSRIQTPEVSIVIPVYNKFIYTYNCLKAVLEHTGDMKYEVIIVDNASTDETTEISSIVRNITVIRNKENLGFVGACNEGASKARGKYILFLNNDTKVQDGWLEAMVEVVESDAEAGAVGAKLILPDGTLQEAGGIVWNDERHPAWNFGRGKDPCDYEYNYLTEVDYSSAACLLVRRVLFDEIGGFDARYSPAYFEDTDLAFSVRKAGYKVMYQPRAEVIHFEGQTAGRDTSRGMKQYQETNTKKFFEKWKAVLEKEHYKSGGNLFPARSRSRSKKILLFIEDSIPAHDRDAGSLSTFMYLKLFADMGIKVVFMPDNYYKTEPYTAELQQMGIEVMYGRINFNNWIRLNGKHIDYIWLSRPHVSLKYVDGVRRHTSARVIYSVCDLHYLRTLREYEVKKDKRILKEADRLKRLEFKVFNRVDTIVTFSDREAEIIKEDFSEKDVKIIPLFVYDEIPAETQTMPSFGEREDIVYLGGFKHLPNADAVQYFIRDIFPLVKKKLPDVKFYVVGNDPPEEIKKLISEDVVVTGYVRDLTEYFKKSRVFVAPLRFGAGVKGKILTSMSYGVPVVTTSIGNEGLNMKDRLDCMLTDDTKEFADRVIELYSDKKVWERLSKNAVRFIKENFSESSVAGTIDGVLAARQ